MRRLQALERYGYPIRQFINESFQLLARDFTFTCHCRSRSRRTIRRGTLPKNRLHFMKWDLMTQKASSRAELLVNMIETNSWHRMTEKKRGWAKDILHMKAAVPLPNILLLFFGVKYFPGVLTPRVFLGGKRNDFVVIYARGGRSLKWIGLGVLERESVCNCSG